MDDFELERQLRETWRHADVPAGFAGRVLERTVGTDKHIPWWRRPAIAWSLASLVMVSVVGTEAWRVHEERVEGQRAKAELMLALRITGQKVQFAQSKLRGE